MAFQLGAAGHYGAYPLLRLRVGARPFRSVSPNTSDLSLPYALIVRFP